MIVARFCTCLNPVVYTTVFLIMCSSAITAPPLCENVKTQQLSVILFIFFKCTEPSNPYSYIISSSSLPEYSPCAIEPADRLTCGWAGVTENDCKSLGCCYQSGACFKTDALSNNCKYQLICLQKAHLQKLSLLFCFLW